MLASGRAVLMDFGLAKHEDQSGLTSAGAVLGTPEFMAPEQAEGLPAGPPADLYSLGVVLYQGLTGRLPFTGKNALSILRQHMQDPPPPLRSFRPELDPKLEAVVLRCLDKRPAGRFASCARLAEALLPFCPSAELRRLAAEPSPEPAATPPLAGQDTLVETILDLEAGVSREPLPREARARPSWRWALAGFLGVLALGLLVLMLGRSAPKKEEPALKLRGLRGQAGGEVGIVGFQGGADPSQWRYELEWVDPGGRRVRETVVGFQEFQKRFGPLAEGPPR
jgi:serine/threonine-protein kinase